MLKCCLANDFTVFTIISIYQLIYNINSKYQAKKYEALNIN